MPHTTIYAAPRRGTTPGTLPPAVATADLARLFGRSAALAGVSLIVQAGQTVSLLGPNGAGKTTLLRILATTLRPSFGTAAVDGLDVADDADLVRTRVAYLPHATGLYDDLTATENLVFAARMHGHPGTDASDLAARILADVGLVPVAGERVRGFSAGMRRRLALGRLLLARPSLVLLDEPHAALDAEGMGLVDDLVGRWHAVGITVVIASHQAERVQRLSTGWAVLDGGVLTEVGGAGISTAAPAGGGRPARSAAGADA